MKRLILTYKQRDGLDSDTGRSVFYALMFKVLNTIANTSEYKAL